jgi:hypothetical protein
MKVKDFFQDSSPAWIIVLILGIVYIFISYVHFGSQFYDLDKLITNLAVGLIIMGFSYLLKKDSEREKDVGAISKKADDTDNKLVDLKNSKGKKREEDHG